MKVKEELWKGLKKEPGEGLGKDYRKEFMKALEKGLKKELGEGLGERLGRVWEGI